MTTTQELTPLERTRQLLDISVTERYTFKACRRRWELQVLENLTPRIPPTFAPEFGTGLHEALEAYYKAYAQLPDPQTRNLDPLEESLIAFDRWYEVTEEKLVLENAPSEQLDTLITLTDLGEEMLEGYAQYAKMEDHFTVHAIEGRSTPAGESWLKKHWEDREFVSGISASAVTRDRTGRLHVPILNPRSKKLLKGRPVLSARIDLLVLRSDPGMAGLWIYDHKSTDRQPSDRGLDFDDQVTGYCYAVYRWLGIVPRGVCFSYLIKNTPKPPRILKDKKLSTAKDQLCTAADYKAELIKRGLMLRDGTVKSAPHGAAYEALLSRGWSPFFTRHYVSRNLHELMAFEERLYHEYKDMKKCYEGELEMYPNLTRGCANCRVAPICQAMEDGSDYEDVIENRFEDGPDRKAQYRDES